MGRYGTIQEDFLAERTRLLEALQSGDNRRLSLRLIGALAFRTHCPEFGRLQDALGRVFTDIDFVGYSRDFQAILRFLTEAGYDEDKMVTRLFGEGRLIFHDPVFGRHIDVFLDKLDFCHPVPFIGRLEADWPTLPLAELLLEKMQIVRINEKDLIDTIMLLREHPVGDSDQETVNAGIIARTLANDWGYWRTVTGNLKLTDEVLHTYVDLTDKDRWTVHDRIEALQERIEAAPKTLKWKARAAIGEKIKWYRDVEELMDR
jgi:hypothetical protein